jgi:hypothetical protein
VGSWKVWKTTQHAPAFDTLQSAFKGHNLDCSYSRPFGWHGRQKPTGAAPAGYLETPRCFESIAGRWWEPRWQCMQSVF